MNSIIAKRGYTSEYLEVVNMLQMIAHNDFSKVQVLGWRLNGIVFLWSNSPGKSACHMVKYKIAILQERTSFDNCSALPSPLRPCLYLQGGTI